VRSRTESCRYRGHSATVCDIAWSPDGTMIASGSYDQMVQIWGPTTGETLAVREGAGWNSMVAWSPDGSVIASVSQDHTLQVWECLSGQLRYQQLSAWNRPMLKVAWSPDGTYLAVASSAGELLDGRTGELIRKFGPRSAGMDRIVWSPKGTHLAFLQETSAQVLRVKYE